MSLFIAAVVSGIVVGLLLGLFGFGIVFLYKATGIANFAQGSLATLGGFLTYRVVLDAGVSLWLAMAAAVVLSALVGAAIYWLFMRPREHNRLNLIIRTLGVQMLLLAIIEHYWSAGQPFPFPSVYPQSTAFVLGDAVVSWASLGIAATAIVLAAAFALFFSRTDLGLLFLGLSERRDIAGMLGVPTRKLSMIAWMIAAVISVVVGVLLAPTALLSSDMMEPYMLLAFTAVVIGGLTSLYGVFVGGIIVGVVNNLVSLYFSSDAAVLSVFVLLLLVLGFRPQGIFGDREIERL